MTELLIRLFVRDYRNMDRPEVRERYGKFSGIVGIVSNLLLFVMKAVTGFVTGSISIVADAVNNLSDSASSVITLVGFKLSGKPADQEHPYGHARIEYISGLIVSFLILLLGVQLLQESAGKIFAPEEAAFSPVAVVVLVVSCLIKTWQCLFYRKVGRRISSPTIEATAADSRSDVFSTLAVLLGLVISRLTGFNLDGYMGVAVALLILWTGVKVVKETSDPLLGTAPAREVVDDIYRTILSYDGILGLHDLNVHMYGEGRTFASVHCEVDAHEDILASHDLVDNIERDFLKQKNIHLVIHMDPIVVDDAPTNALREQVREVLRGISPEITMHDFRVVWGKTHSNVLFDVCVPFGFRYTDAALLDEIANGIYMLGKNYVPVVTVDHSYVPEHRQDS
ncbi:MAG: cation-efflux pump [Clostridiales bacterium]|nr:MAG: cation-efflux pump [Clostridiales bacterium]